MYKEWYKCYSGLSKKFEKNRPSAKGQLVKVVECNLDELLTLEKVLRHDYDVFYHFGWDGTYGESRQDLYLQNSNVKYTLDAVNLAKFLNCRVFIGAGSQSEFGHIDGILHPYAHAILIMVMELQNYKHADVKTTLQ